MKTRKIGTIEVSAVGYGCMGLSHGYGATPSKDEAIHLIRCAHDMGCSDIFNRSAQKFTFGVPSPYA